MRRKIRSEVPKVDRGICWIFSEHVISPGRELRAGNYFSCVAFEVVKGPLNSAGRMKPRNRQEDKDQGYDGACGFHVLPSAFIPCDSLIVVVASNLDNSKGVKIFFWEKLQLGAAKRVLRAGVCSSILEEGIFLKNRCYGLAHGNKIQSEVEG